MTGFSSKWLTYREPLDHAARSETVISALAHYFLNQRHLEITDLGSGTGSTVRALRPFLSQTINWTLIDNDETLLSDARSRLDGIQNVVFTFSDISNSFEKVFEAPTSLITTSAFLDLVSERWLQDLVHEITNREIPFYAALTYDGRSDCKPVHPADTDILQCFNTHQQTDKGFGPALGPHAATAALRLFEKAGYHVVSEKSDWEALGKHPEFQSMLVDGWYQAACNINPDLKETFKDWLNFRMDAISTGKHEVLVGHIDFFAAPK